MSHPTDKLCRRPAVALVSAVATAFVAAGCGSQATDTAQPASSATATSRSTVADAGPSGSISPDAGPSPATGPKEQVTVAGVAALVAEHLGKDAVAGFGHYGGQPGQVDLMVELSESGRADMFGVTVYSPRLGREFAEMAKCPTRKQLKRDTDTKEFTCHRLENGTTVTAYRVASGFSDDNADGQVITGMAAAPDKSAAIVMYESYDKTAPISVPDVDSLLSDPQLTWMTDPAVNAAGTGLKIRKLRG
jgi:hypothetical protein